MTAKKPPASQRPSRRSNNTAGTARIVVENVNVPGPADLFPGGAKAGWWMKTVQLDLEAKRIIAREKTKPLRWHRL